jgi:hypothetical protein
MGNKTSQTSELPPEAQFCSKEGDTCNINKASTVFYGGIKGGMSKYTQTIMTDKFKCTNDVMGGDPLEGIPKTCYYIPPFTLQPDKIAGQKYIKKEINDKNSECTTTTSYYADPPSLTSPRGSIGEFNSVECVPINSQASKIPESIPESKSASESKLKLGSNSGISSIYYIYYCCDNISFNRSWYLFIYEK